MTQQAPKKVVLYRAHIRDFNGGECNYVHEELFELEEEATQFLEEKLLTIKNKMNYDVAGYVEEITLRRVATK